jgi:hypothetical protein
VRPWLTPSRHQTWIDKEFQPSSLSKQRQQLAEMQWFVIDPPS